ncbi:hypothetical protein OROGR_014097 [Orobanche gracilis]
MELQTSKERRSKVREFQFFFFEIFRIKGMARGRGRANTERGRGRGRIQIKPEQPARVPVIGAVEAPESYGIELPEYRKGRWERLGGKKMLPTRWPDEECMNAMGIKDDVMKLLERIG